MSEGFRVLSDHVEELYKGVSLVTKNDMATICEQTLVSSPTDYLGLRPISQVTQRLIILMATKPDISRQIHTASAKTVEAFIKASSLQDPRGVKEAVFFVFNRGEEGIFTTVVPEKPAAYDLDILQIETVEDKERETMAMVHTHPPLGDVLAPSVIEVRPDGKLVGDLYVFIHMNKIREEAVRLGEKSFIQRPLSLILQDDLLSFTTKMLFIVEGGSLGSLSDDERIRDLRDFNRKMKAAKKESVVQRILSDLGFNSSFLEIPSEQFYDYPIGFYENWNKIGFDLRIGF